MISSISFANVIKPQYRNFKTAFKSNLYFGNSNSSLLAPLKQDTVSFSNPTKIEKDNRTKTLNKDLMNAFNNQDVCVQVYKEAEFARDYLNKILTNDLNSMLTKNNPKGNIYSIDSRVKTPDSMREKIASELGAAITAPTPYAFNPNKKDEIKAHCGDLVGARIVMGEASQENNGKILRALMDDIRTGKLKVTGIEHYVSPNDESLNYFSPQDLQLLENAVNEQRTSKGLEPIQVKTKTKASGYMALHLNVDLSSSDFKVKNNGYKGEIQFIGYDVWQFKELEDLCYKLNSDKDIKSGNYAYGPFAAYFKEQIANPNYPNLKNDFLEYTRKAYIVQRKKAPLADKTANKKIKKPLLPSIEECNMQGKIPPQLDFNLLNKIKASCDNIYRNTTTYADNQAA